MSDRGSPEIENLIAEAIDSRMLNIWIAGPGIVKSYDSIRSTVTVQPAVRRPIETEEGKITQDTPAPVQNVPVVWLGAQAFSAQWIPQSGDIVLLVYLDFSPAMFRKREDVSDAPDTRKNGPSYPVAVPWFFGTLEDSPHPSIGIPSGLRLTFKPDVVEVGDGDDAVALAGPTNARLTALESFATAQATFNGAHVHTGVTPGILSSGVAAGSPAAPGAGASVASTNLKAD